MASETTRWPRKTRQGTDDSIKRPNPPLRLLVGNAAVDSIDKYLKECRSEFETWREVSANTDFD